MPQRSFHSKKRFRLHSTLTSPELIVVSNHALGVLAGDVKPFGGVAQIFVLDRQVLRQYWPFRQPIRERAEQLVIFVLVLVVAVASREHVVIKLHHGEDACVEKIFVVHDRRARVLPQPGQHVRSVHSYVGFYPEPLLSVSGGT